MACLVVAQDEIGILGKINDINIFGPYFNKYGDGKKKNWEENLEDSKMMGFMNSLGDFSLSESGLVRNLERFPWPCGCQVINKNLGGKLKKDLTSHTSIHPPVRNTGSYRTMAARLMGPSVLLPPIHLTAKAIWGMCP